jgi:hypothetical protein
LGNLADLLTRNIGPFNNPKAMVGKAPKGQSLMQDIESVLKGAKVAANILGPGADIKDMIDLSGQSARAAGEGNLVKALLAGGAAALAPLGIFFPGSIGGIIRNMPTISPGSLKVPRVINDPVHPSRASQFSDDSVLVIDARKSSGAEGIFPTKKEAKAFIDSHPDGRFFDYGTPREIETFNPTGEESDAFIMQSIKDLVRRALATNNN